MYYKSDINCYLSAKNIHATSKMFTVRKEHNFGLWMHVSVTHFAQNLSKEDDWQLWERIWII